MSPFLTTLLFACTNFRRGGPFATKIRTSRKLWRCMALKMYPKESKPPPKIKYVIGIAAGKGGVGKSSVTVNLARALKWCGYSVGIMDTDVYGPSIKKMLKQDQPPQQKGEIIVPAWCEGLRMISMAYFRKENEAAVVRAPIANGIISQFIKNVEWGDLDYLLIDFPPGTGDIQLTLSQQANLLGAIMVTTPQEIAVMDVRKAMHMFNQVRIPIVGVVENMSFYLHEPTGERLYLFGKGGGERLALEAGVPYLGYIPIDPEICRSGDDGRSFFGEEKNDSLGVKCYKELAYHVIAQAQLLKDKTKNSLENFELLWKQI
jgi:ATP-binding protein involved in chromosome partitioning